MWGNLKVKVERCKGEVEQRKGEVEQRKAEVGTLGTDVHPFPKLTHTYINNVNVLIMYAHVCV